MGAQHIFRRVPLRGHTERGSEFERERTPARRRRPRQGTVEVSIRVAIDLVDLSCVQLLENSARDRPTDRHDDVLRLGRPYLECLGRRAVSVYHSFGIGDGLARAGCVLLAITRRPVVHRTCYCSCT